VFVARIESRAYSRATEVLERVRSALVNLYPEEYRNRLKVKEVRTESHHGVPIIVITATLENKKGCETTLSSIFKRLSTFDKRHIMRTIELRVDDQCTLFLRIDKQISFLEEVKLSDGPDSISVSIHIRQYPRCIQEDAITYIIDCLKENGM